MFESKKHTLSKRYVVPLVLLALLAFGVAPPAVAKVGGVMSKEAAIKKLETWRQELGNIEALLLEGKAKKARKRGQALTNEIVQRTRSGEEIADYLGTVYVLRAVAAAELGLEREAIWKWHAGIQMFPEIRNYDLTKFGEAGQLLIDHPLDLSKRLVAANEPLDFTKMTPPKRIRGPKPRFPEAKLGMGSVSVIVAALLDVEGIPTTPRILKADGEVTMVVAALEAFEDYRYRPLEIDGVPHPYFVNLTVNFFEPKLR